MAAKMSQKAMKFEDILHIVGDKGRWKEYTANELDLSFSNLQNFLSLENVVFWNNIHRLTQYCIVWFVVCFIVGWLIGEVNSWLNDEWLDDWMAQGTRWLAPEYKSVFAYL